MKNKPTKILSFRVSEELFEKVNKQAEREKKSRTEFAKTLFLPAFELHLETKKSLALQS